LSHFILLQKITNETADDDDWETQKNDGDDEKDFESDV
jgi:hypothetical protein